MASDDLNPNAGAWPPYAFVPGGPFPHPTRSPEGHLFGRVQEVVEPIVEDNWEQSTCYLRGIALFNEGYYWEAHEAWEALWHAHGRKGATADILKALIKLAAAGVKVREGQPNGVKTHASRATALFRAVNERRLLGLDLEELAEIASEIAEAPPVDREPKGTPVSCVFTFRLDPKR